MELSDDTAGASLLNRCYDIGDIEQPYTGAFRIPTDRMALNLHTYSASVTTRAAPSANNGGGPVGTTSAATRGFTPENYSVSPGLVENATLVPGASSVVLDGVVAEEIVRTLVGSIGLVAAVPLTAALAAAKCPPAAVGAPAGGPAADIRPDHSCKAGTHPAQGG